MRLSKYEQETIINFNEDEAVASVYTYNPKLKERLKQMAARFPADCSFVSKNSAGGVTYQISKKLVSIRQPYSEERRQKDRERALAANRRPPTKSESEQKLPE